jgi:membrane associated rhomboid family serine protease
MAGGSGTRLADTVAVRMTGRFAISMPGSRGPNDPWFRIGTLDVTTTVLVIILGVVSMLVWAIEGPDHVVLDKLWLWPDRVLDGQIWRVATWPLVNDPDIWFVIMLAVLWFFGSEIERLLGRVRFAVFLLLVTIIPGIVGALIDLPQVGLRPVELCVFLLFVVEYPFARFFFGIPAWVVGAVILGIDVLQLLGDRNERGVAFLFVALAVAALTARSMGLLSNLPWVPVLPLGRFGSGVRRQRPSRQRPRRSGRGGDVVAGPWTSSRGGPTGPLPQPPVSSAEAARDQAELDALLDKISEHGMDGLTGAEKSRLNELSKRMRRR